MPAKITNLSEKTTAALVALGRTMRARRKALRVGAAVCAQAAGISRITLYRMENGWSSVTLGAYLSVADALGLEVELVPVERVATVESSQTEDSLPVRIHPSKYPWLKRLAWQIHGTDVLTPKEALGIYQRNWRHVDEDELEPQERNLIKALRLAFADVSIHD
ncbi:helix-turn-helix domain-containing protein [Desulfofustis limnaeus]|jgi:DNA-binding phage protein|uniref:XRE family transcriptional regulator n=1 Tax=Desulfofustis limnaeus TaxID=2740163 RepID=A0ABM7W9T2_9BACT|nr:helix-turn-helix transcriptional regulator [Desulfofustis limnaeus]BDD87678.1 hypothetical protein DPPLL_20430 [Desulfofustis limnaeus]